MELKSKHPKERKPKVIPESTLNPFYQLVPIGVNKKPAKAVEFRPIVQTPEQSLVALKQLIENTNQESLNKLSAKYSNAIEFNNIDKAYSVLKKLIQYPQFTMVMILQAAIDFNAISLPVVNTVFSLASESMTPTDLVLLTRLIFQSPKSSAFRLYLEDNPITNTSEEESVVDVSEVEGNKDMKGVLDIENLPDYYSKLELCDRKYWRYPEFIRETSTTKKKGRRKTGITTTTVELPDKKGPDEKTIRALERLV